MLDVKTARELFHYNRAVLDRYRRSLERLPWRAVVRNRETGHLSMKDTFVHILNVHDGWLNYVVPGRIHELNDPGRFADSMKSWRDIRAYESRVWSGVDRLLARLTPSQLRQKVKAPWMPGEYVLSDALLQTSFEQAHHLGELIAMLWQMDRRPPDMTWIELRNASRRSRPSRS